VVETLGGKIRAGWQREALVTTPTWPAAAPALVTALLPVTGLAPASGVVHAPVATVDQSYGLADVDITGILPTVGVEMQPVYQGLESLWACALGHMQKRIGGVVMPAALGGGAYRHFYEMDSALATSALTWNQTPDGFLPGDNLDPAQRKVRRGTLAADLQTSVWEWLSTMIAHMTLTVEPGNVTLSLLCQAHSVSEASAVNTAATLQASLPSSSPRILSSDCVWRIAPYSSVTPLGAADRVLCTSWSMTIENHLEAGPGPGTGNAPGEYERARVPEVSVTFTLPRHTLDIWQTRARAKTVLMADLRCTSERMISAGRPYQSTLYFPSLIVQANLDVPGPAPAADTVLCTGVRASTIPAGFPVLSRLAPLAVEIISPSSVHPLL